jgi:hypothetical protein
MADGATIGTVELLERPAVLRKLGVSTRSQAGAEAARLGIVER